MYYLYIYRCIVFRWAKLRNPLLFGATAAIIYNFVFKFY